MTSACTLTAVQCFLHFALSPPSTSKQCTNTLVCLTLDHQSRLMHIQTTSQDGFILKTEKYALIQITLGIGSKFSLNTWYTQNCTFVHCASKDQPFSVWMFYVELSHYILGSSRASTCKQDLNPFSNWKDHKGKTTSSGYGFFSQLTLAPANTIPFHPLFTASARADLRMQACRKML